MKFSFDLFSHCRLHLLLLPCIALGVPFSLLENGLTNCFPSMLMLFAMVAALYLCAVVDAVTVCGVRYERARRFLTTSSHLTILLRTINDGAARFSNAHE